MKNLSSKKINEREVELKILMLKSGIRNKDVTKKTNLSPTMVTQYIKGDRGSPRLDKFFKKLKKAQ